MAIRLSITYPQLNFSPLSKSTRNKMVMIRSNSIRTAMVPSAMQVSVAPPVEGSAITKAIERIVTLPSSVVDTATMIRLVQRSILEGRCWALKVQMFIEKVIVNCRFFTLAAVFGSLIGSVICFLEGCFRILEAFFFYLNKMSQHVDQAETMHLIIEAIDMFLFGSGMLNFGMAMYIMFVGTQGIKGCSNVTISGLSDDSSLRHQMMIRSAMGNKWLSHAKSRLGQALVIILQAGAIDKFKSVPMRTALDLACFAGALLLSAATVFVLSKLHSNDSSHSEARERGFGPLQQVLR